MIPELIIFDFDGTLADTTTSILKTYALTLSELHLPSRTDEQCRATIGLPLKEGFRSLFPTLNDSGLDHCVATYRRIYAEHQQEFLPELYPGVKETLAHIAAMGVKMSIASSRSRPTLVEFCHATDIDHYFSLILGCDDVPKHKPDPEPVLHTLHALGAGPEATAVVGDMPVDISMGSGAGCFTVGVSYGNSDREALINAGADVVIDRFPDLLRVLGC